MSRIYEFTFRSTAGDEMTQRGSGNVTSVAERNARRRLSDRVKNTAEWFRIGEPRFVKPGER